MKNKLNLLKIFFLLPIVLLFAGIIGAIMRSINFQTIIITIIIFVIFSNNKCLTILKKLIKKGRIYIKKSQYTASMPQSRIEAAKTSLKSIDQLTGLIQNNVAAQGLKYEKKRVEKELLRGDLIVVVFGTGSSGKTSLIRALLKKIVGNVSPSMGSTTSISSYRLQLKSLVRGIQIIDTPGIMEGGEHGRQREAESLRQASRADLLIFVVDSDLRAFEMELISNLTQVGKKLFIVLNKCDLRGENEENKLIALLKNHCRGLINSEDIIPTSASPQSIPIIGSRPLQPNPEINQLIKRIATVLHQEGEELIADNILLQCRNLGESGKQLLDKQRLIESKSCVERYVWISCGVVLVTPLPGIDLLGTAVVNGRMVMEISKIYGVELTKANSKDLAMSVGQTIAGLGIVKGGFSIITNSIALHMPTFLIGKSIQSVTAAWLTRVAGESLITYFQQDQDWGDGGVQEVVQLHYDLNSRESILRQFIKSAMERVIEPAEKSENKQLPPHLKLREEGGATDHENQE